MRAGRRTLLGAVLAVVLIGCAAGHASANRISLNSRSIRAVWEAMEFLGAGGSFELTCPVTLEGTLHSSTIAKVANGLVGYVTRAAVGACGSGEVAVPAESLPWHLQYESFSGTLPSMSAIGMRLLGATWEPLPAFRCFYRSTATRPARLSIATGGALGGASWVTEAAIPKTAESNGICPSEMTTRGTSQSITPLGVVGGIRILLI